MGHFLDGWQGKQLAELRGGRREGKKKVRVVFLERLGGLGETAEARLSHCM
jgi:hypothetical protein